jgi:hypothetical protein
VLLTTGNAWDCVFLHVMNNFFAMFVRSDRAPDLGDPIMMVMFGGSIVAYSTLSLVCMVTTISARSSKRNKAHNTSGRPQVGGDDRNENENENIADPQPSGHIGFNPALSGVLMGCSIFLWQWAVK